MNITQNDIDGRKSPKAFLPRIVFWTLTSIPLGYFASKIQSAGLLTGLWDDPIILKFLCMMFFWFMGPAAIIVLLIMGGLSFINARWKLEFYSTLKKLSLTFGFVGLVYVANTLASHCAMSDAKAFPAKIIPQLENYRAQHGSYPDDLSLLVKENRVPWLIQRHGHYSGGKTYSFSFSDPTRFMTSWFYDNRTRLWHRD